MYPEDPVLVGVINRRRDFDAAFRDHWYRVPQGRAPHGIHAEYVAFFLSKAFKNQNGGVHYYARRTGLELVRRQDLLPAEADHPRAGAWYHKLQLGDLHRKDPPILNPTRRPVSFIYTTWDRFCKAATIADLYSTADAFVDRVFHALQESGIPAQRIWEAERASDDGGAQLRVLCEEGIVIASTAPNREQVIPLPVSDSPGAVKAVLEVVQEAIRRRGGLQMVDVPIEE